MNKPAAYKRNCPICSVNDSTKLYEQSFFNIEKISFLEKYTVAYCNHCGFIYADNIPKQSDFDKYYESLSKYEYREKQGKVPLFKQTANIGRVLHFDDIIGNKSKKILDIGCSTGAFLSTLLHYGYYNISGMDPSDYCVHIVRENLNIPSYKGTLSNMHSLEHKFDAISMIEVLEHVVDLHTTMRNISSILNDEGVLFIEVPNATLFPLNVFHAPFQEFSAEHINYFSKNTLNTLMGLHGFELISCEEPVIEVSPSYSISVLRCGFKKSKEGLYRIEEYIDISNNLEKHIIDGINQIYHTQKPIILWGLGSQCQMLLNTTLLRQCNIICCIDKNMNFHGGQFNGIMVCPPDELKKHDCSVVITSPLYCDEIITEIKTNLHCTNEIINLFA